MSGLFLGKICEVAENKSVVRVDYLGTITPLIPYMQTANSFKRHFSPPRVGEMVVLLDFGGVKVALGSFFNDDFSESGASTSKESIIYEDGTTLSYDTSTSTLEINAPKNIMIVCKNAVNIACQSASINAQNTTIQSSNISLVGDCAISGDVSITGELKTSGTGTFGNGVKIKGDVKVSGDISDSRGNLTGHIHRESSGNFCNPREG
ncbi:MAG: phage baseplate assembly protein V [Wolinella sp.]